MIIEVGGGGGGRGSSFFIVLSKILALVTMTIKIHHAACRDEES